MPEITPKQNVGAMFDSIAHRYDFLNHLLSMGFDFYWREKCVRALDITPSKTILDVATGTCDLAISAMRRKLIARCANNVRLRIRIDGVAFGRSCVMRI